MDEVARSATRPARCCPRRGSRRRGTRCAAAAPRRRHRRWRRCSLAAPWRRRRSPRGPGAAPRRCISWAEPDEALRGPGPRPPGAAAVYLRALCLARAGRALPSAAAFQEVAERYPDSPLRDHALLAKANTFLGRRRRPQRGRGVRARGRRVRRTRACAPRPSCAARRAVFLAGEPRLGAGHAPRAWWRAIPAATWRRAPSSWSARSWWPPGSPPRRSSSTTGCSRATSSTRWRRAPSTAWPAASTPGPARRRDRRLPGRRLRLPARARGAGRGLPGRRRAAASRAGRWRRPRYFQLVLDRYAPREDGDGTLVFASAEQQELVEASLCLLEYSYHRRGRPRAALGRAAPAAAEACRRAARRGGRTRS